MAAAGYPRCPRGTCVDRVIFRDGKPPLPVEFELGFDPALQNVWVAFRLSLPRVANGEAGWSLRCRTPFDFLAWNGRLPEAERFFDAALASLPSCEQ
jgi:hypothetical protein